MATLSRNAVGREQVMAGLARQARSHPADARAAGSRLLTTIDSMIDDWNSSKRRSVREEVRLLDIARDLLIDYPRQSQLVLLCKGQNPPELFMPHAVFVPTDWDLPDVECQQRATGYFAPRWANRVFGTLGRLELDTTRQLWNLAGHLDNAATGRIGPYEIETKIDLSTTSALDAYVHALSALHSGGERTPEEVRASLDYESVTNSLASPWFALTQLVTKIERNRELRGLDLREAWDAALLALVVHAGWFDPAEVGLEGLPPWRPTTANEEGRSSVLAFCAHGEDGPAARLSCFWDHVARASVILEATYPAAPSPLTTPQAPQEAPDSALSTPMRLVSLMLEHPHWSKQEIADAAGVSRTHINRLAETNPLLKKVLAAHPGPRARKGADRPRGEKGNDGTLDAF